MVKLDYTASEREVIKKALMGAARGKGRKLNPEEREQARAKAVARIMAMREADKTLARLHQEMVDSPSYSWDQPKYRRDK